MKNITTITTLMELKKLYLDGAYVLENPSDEYSLEAQVERFGGTGAVGYTFTGEFIYTVCGLPESSILPKDKLYLVIVPANESYKNSILISLKDLIFRFSARTGFNLFAARRIVQEEKE